MQKHRVEFRYSGRRAIDGELFPSASKQVVTGGQMLLGAHCYYYCEGRIPEKIQDRTPRFEIVERRNAGEGWIAEFAVTVRASEMWDGSQYGFGSFLRDSLTAWQERRIFENARAERRQALLAVASSNEPVFDSQIWDLELRRLLYQRISQSMTLLTMPNGTSSAQLEIYLDGGSLGTINRRLYTDEEISSALAAMGALQAALVRPPQRPM